DRGEPSAQRPDDRRLRDRYQGRKMRRPLGADTRRPELQDTVPQGWTLLGLPFELSARWRERAEVVAPHPGVDRRLVLCVELGVLDEEVLLPPRDLTPTRGNVGGPRIRCGPAPIDPALQLGHGCPVVSPDGEAGQLRGPLCLG